MHSNPSPTSLFCKNLDSQILYKKKFKALQGAIAYRSFDLEKDVSLIHQWVNMDYTRTFWQMRGSIGLLRACYQCIQQNPFAHSFIGLMNELPVCQFDLYKVSADELSQHIRFEDPDCGFHLLMSPNNSPIRGLTVTLIKAFLDFYFSQDRTGKMFAEPDIENLKSVDLLERIGFEKLKTVQLSYKTAHVYSLTKQQFHATHQIL
jgi:acetyl CoA:N6-hydroxylysine acetyl transferase